MIEKKIRQFDNLLYLSIFSINSLIIFLYHLLWQKQSILHWGNVPVIPLIKRLQDNNFLPLDNYLSGVTDSPNIVYAQLVNYLSAINQDIFTTLFFIKLLYIFFIPVLTLKFCFILIERYNQINPISETLVSFQKVLMFLMVLCLTNF